MAVVESAGSTSLDTDSSNRYLIANSIYVRYGGALVSTTTFGAWTALGAEFIGNGYRIVWKNGSADQYVVWTTDSAGNWLSQTEGVTGASATIRSLEPGFNQNLNGTGGVESTSFLDNSAATRLYSVAGAYGLSPVSGLLGPQLRYGGALVAAGQFGSWTPLGAELINGNYRVVWKNGSADQYVVWLVDSNGNWLSQTAAVSGNNAEIRSLEAGFGQDLNGNGGVESVSATIDSLGGTTVSNIAGVYVLSPNGGGSLLGPQLRYGGALVTPGQFGSWTPLGAELINGNYRVVWKNGSADQYVVWLVDANGNWLSQTAAVSGSSAEIRSLEPGFNQDLNGAGGIEARTPIEQLGSTELVSVANTYVLSPSGSSLGPQLRYFGSLVVPGQFGSWTPIGAEANGSNYAVAWKNGSADQYVVWNVDSNGNWLSQTGIVSGSSADIRTLEAAFNQNLNSTGGIDARTVIESSGFSTLASIANFYTLAANGNSIGQVLKFNGAAVTSGQFGSWTPLAAEMSGGMYRLAWKNGSADQYIAWNIDTSGNFVSWGAIVGGNTWWSESYEPVVNYDVNGDGIIGTTTSGIESTGGSTLTRVADSYFINYGSSNIQVKYGGTYASVGQFGAWTPLAVEFSGGMYRLAWKNGSADQYIAWNLDTAGNWVSQGAIVGSASWSLQSYEPTLSYDLNGDGIIGPVVTGIEASGVSSLSRAADSYFINYGTQNLQLRYGGNYFAAGQSGAWAPIAAELTNGSYIALWRNGAADQYIVWNIDAGGNLVWQNATAFSAGSSLFQAVEASFQQDVNGGGIPAGTTIEAIGSVILRNVGGYLLLDAAGSVAGPLLSFVDNNYVTASQFGTALGAEWTGGGYRVAWKTGTDSYNFWNTDTAGRYVSQTGNLAGSSAQMQSFEPSFNQDLNGDGVIGVNNNPFTIQFSFSGQSQYQSYFQTAANRWQRVIRNDLPSVGNIDDLQINVNVAAIDPNYLALARPLAERSGARGLPYLGEMTFNSIYMDQMVRDGILTSVIAHEMGHVLGIGTLWSSFGLLSGFSYVGTNANNAYRQLGGTGNILVENVGGSASILSHWRESVFDSELMTSQSEARDPMPLSIMTIGALQDLGYTVDYGAADSYRIPGIGLAAAGSDGADGSLAPEAYREAYASSPNPNASLVPEAYLAEYLNSIGGTAGSTAPGPDVGNVSLLTNYMANSFVTSAGEGTGTIVPAETNSADVLTRPYA